jgi:RNA polymerase sigma factor (TIGR02999 family)
VEITPGEVTQLLLKLRQGDREAEDRLIPLVYGELRRIAAGRLRGEHPGHSLQPTALVHEAYIRLTAMQEIDWECRAQFFALAAKIMRNVLVDHARAKHAHKRPQEFDRVDVEHAVVAVPERSWEILAIDQALERLKEFDPTLAKVVEYRFFAGMTDKEIGGLLSRSDRTVKRDWQKARAWLYKELEPRKEGEPTLRDS